jgi:hypothetical protein
MRSDRLSRPELHDIFWARRVSDSVGRLGAGAVVRQLGPQIVGQPRDVVGCATLSNLTECGRHGGPAEHHGPQLSETRRDDGGCPNAAKWQSRSPTTSHSTFRITARRGPVWRSLQESPC